MEIYADVVEAVGDTPMVRLGRIHKPGNLLAKLEFLNPGGSGKDRIGLAMIERAEENRGLEPGGSNVEPISGHTAGSPAGAASRSV